MPETTRTSRDIATDPVPQADAAKHVATASGRGGWWGIGLASGTMVLLWMLGDTVRDALRYQRDAVVAGEYWRLLTGHWVHGDFKHLALNLLGIALTAALGNRAYRVKEWIVVLAVSLVAIDVGFLALEPGLEWYVGASGVLHGAMAAAAVAWWRIEPKPLALLFGSIVVGKLVWEQTQGALPLAGEMPVVIDAHLYGAIGGAIAALALEARRLMRRRRAPHL